MIKNCKTCKAISEKGIDILGVHICNDCLNSISILDMEGPDYEIYKDIIGDAWKESSGLKLN